MTEIALLEALSANDDPPQESISPSEKKSLVVQNESLSKDARMEEWKKFPIETIEDRKYWREEKLRMMKSSVEDTESASAEGFLEREPEHSSWINMASVLQARDSSMGDLLEQYGGADNGEGLNTFGHVAASDTITGPIAQGIMTPRQPTYHISTTGGNDLVALQEQIVPLEQHLGDQDGVGRMHRSGESPRIDQGPARGILSRTSRNDRSLNSDEWQKYF